MLESVNHVAGYTLVVTFLLNNTALRPKPNEPVIIHNINVCIFWGSLMVWAVSGLTVLFG